MDPDLLPHFKYAVEETVRKYCWSINNVDKIVDELYVVLECKSLAQDPMQLSLPPRLDACWHELILNTESYNEICNYYGRFLHHTTRTAHDSAEQKQARINNLLDIYTNIYPKRTRNAWCWVMENRRRKRQKRTTIAVYVRSSMGMTFYLTVSPDMPFGTFMRIVLKRHGITNEPLEEYWFPNCHSAKYDKTLEECKIDNNRTLSLVRRMRGC